MHPKTFAKLPTWTSQQVFDVVLTALRKQGKPSQDASRCVYRGDRGRMKCAVGHLIPRSLYEARMEGKVVDNLVPMYPEELAPLVPHVPLLRRLQHAHDDWGATFDGTTQGLERRFHEVAQEFNLAYKES